MTLKLTRNAIITQDSFYLYTLHSIAIISKTGVGKLGRRKVGLGKLDLGRLGYGKVGRWDGKLNRGTTSESPLVKVDLLIMYQL